MMSERCEKVRLAAMAALDGETPPLSEQEIREHLAGCAACRAQVEQLQRALAPLKRQKLRVVAEDVWPGVEAALRKQTAPAQPRREACVFAALGLFLLACKIVGVLPELAGNWLPKVLPLAAALVLFCVLKQNPFQITGNLKLEGNLR
ncbi:MAG: zf-HC2 domain-containing protein [Sedimentisphaerales bacterium]|jgi:predicted anti-sigma-YlaC factor YlaD|nr:zf-HC2 domain-containing protein [Sedimentisphaerales bacterium]HPX42074.1 zf-HC2 domain-containing protein [Candidatus Hydrogenedentota bacterium]HNY78113.1 zf-HC2 domain-containing protein [Sedimentisphaerales bacterium]HOC62207.1 zf-HC2 domain-containing protein [Sedimentisphaerales bacterium]HOH63151.1 zf-HC2 domain-containing protein [Sedimentisphaerales bacterium]